MICLYTSKLGLDLKCPIILLYTFRIQIFFSYFELRANCLSDLQGNSKLN